jgi:hypothetical protein
MYDFQLIHNKILEDLSKIDKCSNFILTSQQFKNALDTNKKIIKPYVGFTNDKKEFIDIREYIIDKLTKYKIVGVKTGRYGYTDNYFYIIFINIHGDVYGNIFLEHRHREKHNTLTNGIKFISHDWYLELFIKPFAIQPEHCNTKCIRILNTFNQTVVNYISLFNDNLYWSPYIDKNHYSCKALCIDDKIIELYDEPKYKEYIESDKIIPKYIIDDILNDKFECKFECLYEDIYDVYNTDRFMFNYKINDIKLYNYVIKNLNMDELYYILIYNNIKHFIDTTSFIFPTSKLILSTKNINLFEYSYLSSLIRIDKLRIRFNPFTSHNIDKILNGKFINVYKFYKTYLDIQNNKKNTALIIACSRNMEETAKLLIEKGCNLDIYNKITS